MPGTWPRDPDTGPLFVRVMFAALGWSNLIGHAEFPAPGGLAILLQSSDPRTGELSIPNHNQVNTAIRRAEAAGLVAEGSSLVSPLTAAWWEKAGGKGGRTCGHHRIHRSAARHTRSVNESGKRHTRSVTATHEECHRDAVTRGNVHVL